MTVATMTAYSLAAPGDTWGISGPKFLQIYITMAVITFIAVLLFRKRLRAGGKQPGQLTAPEVAYLAGGPTQAIYSSLAALRLAGAVDTRGGKLVVSGPMPASAPGLDQAVFATIGYAGAGQGIRTKALADAQNVKDELAAIASRLVDLQLLLGPAQRGARAVALIFFDLLAGLGIVRIVAGINNNKPVTGLIITVAVMLLLTLAFLLAKSPRTRSADVALAHLRLTNAHLTPGLSPAWQTYGPAGAAMGAALFGGAALWALDPAFAAATDITRVSANTGTYGSSSSTSDGGSISSSDSGGDSSGGDSGGCGGGGGCGG